MKMSFDVEINDEINWIAQDKDGEWFGYREEPKAGDDDWIDRGNQLIQLAHGSIPKDWENELYKIIR